jgi:hypothetical protein
MSPAQASSGSGIDNRKATFKKGIEQLALLLLVQMVMPEQQRLHHYLLVVLS